MSRLGKQPINLPAGTQAKIENGFIIVKGPKGELKLNLNSIVKIDLAQNSITLSINNINDKKEKAFWGMYYSLIKNMVEGVNKDFEKKLEVIGVGYKVNVSGKKVILSVGFSHPVEFALPDGISAQTEGNIITISGIDKQLVGETAAQIRKIKKPEPYKGKGIKYIDEIIRRKEGKIAGKASA